MNDFVDQMLKSVCVVTCQRKRFTSPVNLFSDFRILLNRKIVHAAFGAWVSFREHRPTWASWSFLIAQPQSQPKLEIDGFVEWEPLNQLSLSLDDLL